MPLRFVVRALLPVALIVALANLLLGGVKQPDPRKRIERALASGNNLVAQMEYARLIEQDSLNIEWHHGYIVSHHRQPARVGKRYVRDDAGLIAKYEKRTHAPDAAGADVGHYGLGLFNALQGDDQTALTHYRQVSNNRLPFLNNAIGTSLVVLGQTDLAQVHFRREIEVGGEVSEAYANLSQLLQQQGDEAALRKLMSEPGALPHIPGVVRRYLAMHDGDWAQYTRLVLTLPGFHWMGLLATLMILGLWFFYLRQVDVFEPEPLHLSALTVVGGMAASLLVTPLYDSLDFFADFRLNGQYAHDLLFCIFGVGLVEEAVKVLPVLLLLRFTSLLNESVDYFIYGSLSGLGFASMENLLYFHEGSLVDISSRALSSVVLHMVLTSLVMYGLFYSKYRQRDRPLFHLLVAFAAAVVLHGVYDFWLVARGWVGELSIASVVLLIYGIERYGRAINSALNVSEFNQDEQDRLVELTAYLSYGLVATMLLQYVVLAILFGVANANLSFAWTLITSFTLVLMLNLSMGNFLVQKGLWLPMRASLQDLSRFQFDRRARGKKKKRKRAEPLPPRS